MDWKKIVFVRGDGKAIGWLTLTAICLIVPSLAIKLLCAFEPVAAWVDRYLLLPISYPVYLFFFGLLLGVPFANILKHIGSHYKDASRGLPRFLAVLALFCVLVILPNTFLPGLLPGFTRILESMFIYVLLLLFVYAVMRKIMKYPEG